VHLFLRTYAGERSTVVLKDVERMRASNLLQENILFDLVLIQPDKLIIAVIRNSTNQCRQKWRTTFSLRHCSRAFRHSS
jgi:hypothetical protein